jgi:hypothetical protein
MPPRAGIAEGITAGIAPPIAFLTSPPFLSFNSIEGSVVIILTIGLNSAMIYSLNFLGVNHGQAEYALSSYGAIRISSKYHALVCANV